MMTVAVVHRLDLDVTLPLVIVAVEMIAVVVLLLLLLLLDRHYYQQCYCSQIVSMIEIFSLEVLLVVAVVHDDALVIVEDD
jgi:hypothetical protein